MSSNPNRGRFSVNWKGDYLIYMSNIPSEWDAIGVVSRNNDQEKGALLRNKSTGLYAMGNANLIQEIPQHKIQVIVNNEKEKKDGNWNEHRTNKTSIQAFLNHNEIEIVKKIQAKRDFKSYRETLVTLCEEEEKRLR